MSVRDYMSAYETFNVGELEAELEGDLAAGVNACVECCDRHASNDRVALFWEGADGSSRTLSFAELSRQSAQFANLLKRHGIVPGDRVAGLLPRIPELLVVLLGTLRAGAVYQPLFTAFGPKAIGHRLDGAAAKCVVTDTGNRAKLDGIDACPFIVTVGGASGDVDFHEALATESSEFEPVMLRGDEPFLMLFTSGTTGPPKGVSIPLKALLAFIAYMKFGLDLRPDDRFWNIADPGWAYGLYYAAIGPLLVGCATTMYEGPFSVEKTYAIVDKLGVTNFAGAPTAYRMMIAAGDEAAAPLKGQLRVATSAGEPLNPEVMRWFADKLDCPLLDQYGQTEIGMALVNHHGLRHPVHPGSAGRAMPGFELAVVDEDGNPLPNGQQGTLAVHRARSPLFFFPGYWGREGQDWVGEYYLTGDSVERDDDGSFSFVGRSDDVISSAGYRIGPFDVESSLIEHEAVLESAVVGKPDAERGAIVNAFVVLRDGHRGSDELAEALRLLVKRRLGAHAYPREVVFVDALPKTPSGKIQRFLLREKS
jgi:acetyl-CoA synthetase